MYRVAPDVAIVETLDFFPPIVDDPYAAGAIAAANAMSDVYAMGGEVLFALNIVAWPEDLSFDALERLMQGAVDKIAEGDGVIAGGHTVIDREPKFGLAVTGRAHPDRLFMKGALHPGDALWLTKPIGTGVLTTAHKNGDAEGVATTLYYAAETLGIAASLLLPAMPSKMLELRGALGLSEQPPSAAGGWGHLDPTAPVAREARLFPVIERE